MSPQFGGPEAMSPTAVHGKYVPGLPWDTLPPPVPEPEVDGPDPLVERIRDLDGDLDMAFDEEQEAEDEASRARSRQREIRDEIDGLMKTLRTFDGSKWDALKVELGL